MLLHDLIRQFDPAIDLKKTSNPSITGIQEDSRLVKPGDLFIARTGTKTDGAKFIADAQTRGAVAVMTIESNEKAHGSAVGPNGVGASLPQISTNNQSAVTVLANLFYDSPARAVRVLGVTGTKGKTTVAYHMRHILAKAKIKCGMIGTVEIDDGKSKGEADMTTPGAVEVARLLAAMRDNGCQACAIETSSHALDQNRVSGVRFAAGGFTNLTGDHFDYHKTAENYAAAKARLFDMLPDDSPACVNMDDPAWERMVRNKKTRVLRWGFGKDADYRASDIRVTSAGSNFILITPDGQSPVHMQLIGRHNIANALCAAAMIMETFGIPVHRIASALSDSAGAPGRLQSVRAGQSFAVLVDYAHTDDALLNVLTAMRPLTKGKLRVLFGCGGDRDRTKRPRMAAVCQKLADVIYVTSDNPRTENPQAIIDEIMTGFSADKDKTVIVEPDRRRAIEQVLGDAGPEDVVLLAGKGHENYQIVGTTKHHFDDVEEATRALRARVGVT